VIARHPTLPDTLDGVEGFGRRVWVTSADLLLHIVPLQHDQSRVGAPLVRPHPEPFPDLQEMHTVRWQGRHFGRSSRRVRMWPWFTL